MTGLLRTTLSTPLKAELAASAFALQGVYGAVSDLANDFGVSRPTVYAAGDAALSVLHDHFQRAESNDVVWLRVDRAQLERTIVGLRIVAPNSIRDIEELLPIIYPGVSRSYGFIQAICTEAQGRAAEHNKTVDLSAIDAAALDELFSQRQPVLAGIDLDTGYSFAVSLQARRAAEQWASLLREAQQQGLDLSIIVKDAAKGIAAGVTEIFPEAEQRDDCFHAHYEMSKVARYLENAAYGRIAAEEKAREKLDNLRRKGKGKASRQSLAMKLSHAKRRADRAIERYDTFAAAQREVEEALHFIDLQRGRLRTPKQMEKLLRRAGAKMVAIKNHKATKVGRYIINRAPGLALHIKVLRKELAKVERKYGSTAVRVGAVIYRLWGEIKRRREKDQRQERSEQLAAAYEILRELEGERSGDVLKAISQVLEKRHRASSAIEGFNAGLRPYLYVHKGVSQGFLGLFQAYQNLRTRRWGRLKGRSAHEALTGEVVDDWLTILGYPPSSEALH